MCGFSDIQSSFPTCYGLLPADRRHEEGSDRKRLVKGGKMKGFCPNDGYRLFQTEDGKLIRCLICGYTVTREEFYKKVIEK